MGLIRTPIKKELRKAVIEKFNGCCAYCGCLPDKIYVDHLKPVAAGGDNSFENLMPACFSCNNYKTVFDLEQFRTEVSEQVNRARRYNVNFRIAERYGLIKEVRKPIIFYFEQPLGG